MTNDTPTPTVEGRMSQNPASSDAANCDIGSTDTPTPTAFPPEYGIPSEADWEAWPSVLQIIRDEIGKAEGRGRKWDEPTTIGEVAEECGTTPAEIHRLILQCGHLVEFIRDEHRPIADWIVFEDGE